MDRKTLKTIFQASYYKPKQSAKELEDIGFIQDPTMTTNEAKVFYNPSTKEAHIAHRGTTTLKDIGTDIQLTMGYTPKRLTEARRLTKAVKEKYNAPVSAYGTSMGGYLAEKSGADKVYTYNKAVAPQDILKRTKKNQTDYRTSTDIVSLPSILQGRKKTIKTTFVNPIAAHTVKYFK